jgi:phosphoribosylformylglycinamidine (FGAM) synthase PurS component
MKSTLKRSKKTAAEPEASPMDSIPNGPTPARAGANREVARAKMTKSEASREMWRKRREGTAPLPTRRTARSVNPLLDLSEEARAKLFAWMRDCPYNDAVLHMLKEQGIEDVKPLELEDFFQFEAEQHWEKRIQRAAQEANALVKLVEKSPVKFSSGILAALGQEAFRQIASGQVEPVAMGKLATLFLKARSDERADQMQELRREKLRRDLQGQIEHALEKFAEEVERHPAAKEAFEALRREMATCLEKTENAP